MGPLPRFARLPVLSAVVALAAVLVATAGAYGYERDELYFRMLPPAWGYVDQPPLTPLIVHGISGVADSLLAIRTPAILLAAASVIVVSLVAREAGGGRLAQGLAAWGMATGTFTLTAGHVFLTATWDLVVWPLVLLAVFRARLRADPRWWLLAGLVAGVSTYDKLLVADLLVAIAVGLAVLGPRGGLVSPWTVGAVLLLLVIASPNLLYQATHGLPQLAMGQALAAHKAGAVRPEVVPFLVLLLGPTLVPFWVSGFVALIRRRTFVPIRFFWLTFVLIVALVIAMGTQAYYPYPALATLYAVGCVPVAEWVRSTGRRAVVVAAIALNGAAGLLLDVPLIPVGVVGRTPIPAINQTVADSIGWPAYAAQIASAFRRAGPEAIVLTGNYGEAGAMARFAPRIPTYSGQNALHDLTPPPAGTRTIVAVDGAWLSAYFAHCRTVTHLDDGDGVDNEEQGVPVSICTTPLAPISTIWAAARHLD